MSYSVPTAKTKVCGAITEAQAGMTCVSWHIVPVANHVSLSQVHRVRTGLSLVGTTVGTSTPWFGPALLK